MGEGSMVKGLVLTTLNKLFSIKEDLVGMVDSERIESGKFDKGTAKGAEKKPA